MLQAEKLLEGELASQQKQNKATESPWPQAMPHPWQRTRVDGEEPRRSTPAAGSRSKRAALLT